MQALVEERLATKLMQFRVSTCVQGENHILPPIDDYHRPNNNLQAGYKLEDEKREFFSQDC